MPVLSNLDLLTVGIAVASIGILGFTVYFNDKNSSTNKAFLLFSILSILWTLANYAQYNIHNVQVSFWVLRLVICIAVLLCTSFFWLFFVIPDKKREFPRWFLRFVLPYATFVSLLSFSPLVFEKILLVEDGKITSVQNGPGIFLFGLTVTAFVFFGILTLVKKILRSTKNTRGQLTKVLYGFILSFILLLTFNFFFPAFLANTKFIPFGGLFLLPLVAFTSFSIYQNKLFNIKVAITSILVFALCVAIFFETIFTQDTFALLRKIFEFFLVLVSGILLIRSVLQEVRAREEIAELAQQLTDTNHELGKTNDLLRIMDQRKSEFVSIASHQLRTPVTAIKGYASMLLEDSYGVLTDTMKDPIQKIFYSSGRLVDMINDFLNVSKIEQGTLSYTFARANFKKMVTDVYQDFVLIGSKKNLTLTCDIPEDGEWFVYVDEGKVRQIISNLVDNAIKYTPEGSVHIMLRKEPTHDVHGTIVLEIKDTGIGLSLDDITHLFGKFTRGSEGSRIDTTGSGLGLYIAKKMMAEHKGDIWVESPGKGMGSSFFIELPEIGDALSIPE